MNELSKFTEDYSVLLKNTSDMKTYLTAKKAQKEGIEKEIADLQKKLESERERVQAEVDKDRLLLKDQRESWNRSVEHQREVFAEREKELAQAEEDNRNTRGILKTELAKATADIAEAEAREAKASKIITEYNDLVASVRIKNIEADKRLKVADEQEKKNVADSAAIAPQQENINEHYDDIKTQRKKNTDKKAENETKEQDLNTRESGLDTRDATQNKRESKLDTREAGIKATEDVQKETKKNLDDQDANLKNLQQELALAAAKIKKKS